jgi:hypothetical protein
MKIEVLVFIALLIGCTAPKPETPGGGFHPKLNCDRTYSGDYSNATVIGVFTCDNGYRLVFDALDHEDYYLNWDGEYVGSCKQKTNDPECLSLLKSCKFINICRS